MNTGYSKIEQNESRSSSASPTKANRGNVENIATRLDFLKLKTNASASSKLTTAAGQTDGRALSISKKITNVFKSGSPNKAEADDDKIVRVSGNPNNKSPDKKSMPVMEQKGKNLDQFIVDNPPIKDHGAVLVTDQVFIGDAATSCDASFIRQNKISHIVNTAASSLLNIYDINNINNPEVKQKLTETGQMGSNLVGSISYYRINHWDEHKINRLTDMGFLTEIYRFIQEAVQNFNSCLIVSQRNKCSTVVVAIIYLMMKYKWSVLRSLEYLNARKSDIEITKTIIKQLSQIEQTIESELQKKNHTNIHVGLRNDWEIEDNINDDLNEETLSPLQFQRFGSLQRVIAANQEEERYTGTSPGQTYALMRKQSSLGRNKSIDKSFLNSKYVMVEEEACMINQYLNSLKLEKASPVRKVSQATGGPAKTMKELIDETIRDNARRKELLKKLLDWNELDIVVHPKIIERKQVKQFNQSHFSKKKPVASKKNLVKPQIEVYEPLSVVNEHSYEETDLHSQQNKKREKAAIRRQVSQIGNQLMPPSAKYKKQVIKKAQNVDEIVISQGSPRSNISQQYKQFVNTDSSQDSDGRRVAIKTMAQRKESLHRRNLSQQNMDSNPREDESETPDPKTQQKTDYRKKMQNVLKIIKISKLWKQQLQVEGTGENQPEESSTPKSKNSGLEHKSRSLQKMEKAQENLMQQIPKNRNESFNVKRAQIPLVTPFKGDNSRKLMDMSDQKRMKRAANQTNTLNSASSLSQNRDTSNDVSSMESAQNLQVSSSKNYTGSLKSAEKLQKKVTNTESQVTGQTEATKGLNSNFEKSGSNIGSGINMQKKQTTFTTSQQNTFTQQDTIQNSGSKLSKQDIVQRITKEGNEMNFKLKIQTTIINEEEDEQNIRKSIQRHNSSSELYQNHSVHKITANSSQSVNGNGKLSEDFSDQRTIHSAHSAERGKAKGGLIKPNQPKVKQSVVQDRMMNSQKQSSGDSSVLNSAGFDKTQNDYVNQNQYKQQNQTKQKEFNNQQLNQNTKLNKNEYQSKISKTQQQSDQQLKQQQSRKQPNTGGGVKEQQRTSTAQETNQTLKSRVQSQANESSSKQNSQSRAGNMSSSNVNTNNAAAAQDQGQLLTQKQVQMLRAKHFAPESGNTSMEQPMQKQQTSQNATTPAQVRNKQKQAGSQEQNMKKLASSRPSQPQQARTTQQSPADGAGTRNTDLAADAFKTNATSKREKPTSIAIVKKPQIELNDSKVNDFGGGDTIGPNGVQSMGVHTELKIAQSQRVSKQDSKKLIDEQKQSNVQFKNKQVVEKQGKYLSIKPNQVNQAINSNNTSGVTQPSNTQSVKEYQSVQSANTGQRGGQHRKHRSMSGVQRTHSSSENRSEFGEFDEPAMSRTIRKEPNKKKLSILPAINSASNLQIQSGDLQKRAMSNRAESSQQTALGQSNGFKQGQKQTQSVSQMARQQQQQIKQLNQEFKIQKEASGRNISLNNNFPNQNYRQQDPYNSGIEATDQKIHLLGRQSGMTISKNDINNSARSTGSQAQQLQMKRMKIQQPDSEIGLQAEKAQQQILKQRQIQQQAAQDEKKRQLLLQQKQQQVLQAPQKKKQSEQTPTIRTKDQLDFVNSMLKQGNSKDNSPTQSRIHVEKLANSRTQKNTPRGDVSPPPKQAQLIQKPIDDKAATEKKKTTNKQKKRDESEEEQDAQDYMTAALAKIQAKMDTNQKIRVQEATTKQAQKTPAKQGRKKYTPAEVASHKSLQDCWIILGKGVYDVTKFILQHPGGSMTILEFAGTGKDALAEFNANGHSKNARSQVKQYLIGELA